MTSIHDDLTEEDLAGIEDMDDADSVEVEADLPADSFEERTDKQLGEEH